MKNLTLRIFSLLLMVILLNSNIVFSQNVAINDDGASPNVNSILDVDISSNDKGILIPRLTTTERTDFATNAPLGAGDEGLTVYDTDTNCYWLWDGTVWSRFTTGNQGWLLEGNSGVDPANDFIGTADAQDLVFRTNNSERARFSASGNLGIGTTNPQQILHLRGTLPYVRFTDTDGGNHWYLGSDGGNTRFLIGEYDPTGAGTYYNYRFSIKEGGFTGIGTFNPEGLLHIKADPTYDATLLIDADGGTSDEDTWKIRSKESGNDLEFINHTNTRFTIEAAGNVGIGTTSPEGKLHLNASEGNNATLVIDADEGDNPTDTWKIRSVASNNNLNFINDVSTYVTIESAGNFGVGTDNPDAKLHILGSGTVMGQYAGTVAAFQQNNATGDWGRISIIGGNAGASVLDFGDADKQDAGMLKYDHTDNYLSYSYNDGASQTEILRIEDYGFVGIGTTNPTEKLDVNGAIRIGDTPNSNSGAIKWDGTNFLGYTGAIWKPLDVQTTTGGGWTDGGTDVYLTTTSDNVGIGTNMPGAKLDVTGDIYASQDITTGADVWADNVYATTNIETGEVVQVGTEVNRTAQGTVDLIPFAYGIVAFDGTILHAGTGNWTSSRTSVGKYTIVLTSGGPYSSSSYMTQVSGRNLLTGTGSNDVRVISFGQVGNDLRVYTKDGDGDFASSEFHFIIYKP